MDPKHASLLRQLPQVDDLLRTPELAPAIGPRAPIAGRGGSAAGPGGRAARPHQRRAPETLGSHPG